MEPFVLMFIAVAAGLLFGKIKFGKFNFGISGALFTGLIIGWFIYRYAGSVLLNDNSNKSAQTIDSGVIDNGFYYVPGVICCCGRVVGCKGSGYCN